MKTLFAALIAFAAFVPAAQAEMSHGTKDTSHATMAEERVSAVGTVNTVDAAKRTANLTHEPIAALGWPVMTMDFAVSEDVDLSSVAAGDTVDFTLSRGDDGIYRIDGLSVR